MARTIDYYFTLVSPWAYIGHRVFADLAKSHGAEIVYKPIALGTVFPESGGMPLARRHPLRVAYRMVELQRWREKRGLSFDLKPPHWPFVPTLADCTVLAIAEHGGDVEAFLPRAFAAVFEQGRALGEEAGIAEVLSESGFDANAILEAAKSADIVKDYETLTAGALAAGVFGSPSYVLGGEVFWGQDRLDLLADALASGRKPFAP